MKRDHQDVIFLVNIYHTILFLIQQIVLYGKISKVTVNLVQKVIKAAMIKNVKIWPNIAFKYFFVW